MKDFPLPTKKQLLLGLLTYIIGMQALITVLSI